MHQIVNELQQLQQQLQQVTQQCRSLETRLQSVTGQVEQEERRRQSQTQMPQTQTQTQTALAGARAYDQPSFSGSGHYQTPTYNRSYGSQYQSSGTSSTGYAAAARPSQSGGAVNQNTIQAVLQADAGFRSTPSVGRQSEQPSYSRVL